MTSRVAGGVDSPGDGQDSLARALDHERAVGRAVPLDLAWSGDRRFDLADPVQRYLYHVTALTSAVTPEHYTSWLNASLLRSDWRRLRLPRPLREIWQEHFPELGPG
jgi:hypothetical protein